MINCDRKGKMLLMFWTDGLSDD